jgi:glycosyltransferase involved in cell wall biosynthesis
LTATHRQAGASPHVCIVAPAAPGRTETFIRAHIDRLPFRISFLHGEGLTFKADGTSLRERPESKRRPLLDRSLNLLPRVLEYRLRNRILPRASDSELLEAFLRNEHVDVVLAEYGPTATQVMEACRLAKVPLVAHFHGFDASQTRTVEAFRGPYRAMFRFASTIVAVSEDMRGRLIRLGCSSDKIIVNPYGPSPDFFQVEPDYESNVVLAVGRLTEKKAPHLTLLAFKQVVELSPHLKLRIIGDGSLLGVCRDLIAALNLADNVTLDGPASPEEIKSAMQNSFLLVQHSVTAFDGDSEGTPVAILEAGAAGLPVVSTSHAGISEAVENGVTGILVSEGDIESMGNAIIALAADRQLVREMGAAARKRIASRYSMEQHIGTLSKVLWDATIS